MNMFDVIPFVAATLMVLAALLHDRRKRQ